MNLLKEAQEFFPEAQLKRHGSQLKIQQPLDLVERITFTKDQQDLASFYRVMATLIEQVPLPKIDYQADFWQLILANLPRYYPDFTHVKIPDLPFTPIEKQDFRCFQAQLVHDVLALGQMALQDKSFSEITLQHGPQAFTATVDLENGQVQHNLDTVRLSFNNLPDLASSRSPSPTTARQSYKQFALAALISQQNYRDIHTYFQVTHSEIYRPEQLDDYLYAACHNQIYEGYRYLAGQGQEPQTLTVSQLAKFYVQMRLYLSLPFLEIKSSAVDLTLTQAFKLSQSFEQFISWQTNCQVKLTTTSGQVFLSRPDQPVALFLERNFWYYAKHLPQQLLRFQKILNNK